MPEPALGPRMKPTPLSRIVSTTSWVFASQTDQHSLRATVANRIADRLLRNAVSMCGRDVIRQQDGRRAVKATNDLEQVGGVLRERLQGGHQVRPVRA